MLGQRDNNPLKATKDISRLHVGFPKLSSSLNVKRSQEGMWSRLVFLLRAVRGKTCKYLDRT